LKQQLQRDLQLTYSSLQFSFYDTLKKIPPT